MRNATLIRGVLLAGSAPFVLLAGQAAAQEARPASAQLEEVVVTAARAEQNLQKVSAAVQVVGGSELQEQAVVNVGQLFQTTPSVQATAQPGGFSINIRGQGGDLPAGSTQGSVALEFDGVYNILSLGTTVGFFDVDRVEVLPGPQSTRYGPNADGGVVNVITKDPRLGSAEGFGVLTLGNYGLVRGEAAQNIPIGDTMALRIAAAAIKRDAYLEPMGPNNIGQSVRLKFLYEPNDRLRLRLSYQLDHVGGTGQGAEPYGIGKVAPYSGDSINDSGDPWKKGDYTTNGVGTDQDKSDVTQQSLAAALSYQVSDWAAVDLLASYTKVKGKDVDCYAGGPPWNIGGAHSCYTYWQYDPFNQYSTEVRLHSVAGSPVLWNLGYYHFSYEKGGRSTASPNYAENGTVTNAVFGELTYPVTDRLRLIGGARESWDKRELTPGGVNQTFSRKLSHFDYRVGEEFDLTPNSMQYFTISSGYRPGGLTGYNAQAGRPYTFESEVNTAFELGSKNRFLDNRLQVNADLFYYKQDNYQDIDSYHGFIPAGETSPCRPGGETRPACSVPTFNLAAHAYGLETQVRFSATAHDVFGLSATWLRARFDDEQGTCAVVAAPTTSGCWIGYNDQTTDALLFFDAAGAVQPHSPTFAGTVTYEHTFDLASGQLSVGGDAFYSTSYWVHPVQDAARFGYQPAYWQGDLSASFTPKGANWSVNAYVRNVTDYAVKLSTLPFTSISDPRTFGVTLRLNW